MHRSAIAPALTSALLAALTVTAWTLWPTPAPPPAPAQAVPAEINQFPGLEPADCILGPRTSARQETTE